MIKTFVFQASSFQNIKDDDGVSLFHILCTVQDEGKIVAYVIEKCGSSNIGLNNPVSYNSKFWPGYTPLHFAAAYHCHETVDLLCSYQADFRATTASGLTPLHLVWRMDEAEILMKDILVLASDWRVDMATRFKNCWDELSLIQYNRLTTVENLIRVNWNLLDDIDKMEVTFIAKQNVEIIAKLFSKHFNSTYCEKLQWEFQGNSATFMLSRIETYTYYDQRQ